MIDEAFCWQLELRISEFLENTDDERLEGFWCDGVLPPTEDAEVIKKIANDLEKILMTALIGHERQANFELTLLLGPVAIANIQNGRRLDECIPNAILKDRLAIEVKTKRISIQLD